VKSITQTFEKYPGIGTLLRRWATATSRSRISKRPINKTECDAVVVATPID
jgi:hypothetical protein